MIISTNYLAVIQGAIPNININPCPFIGQCIVSIVVN
nr:MAG TPA: restriction alleviation protein [Caudoviricetes sp.]